MSHFKGDEIVISGISGVFPKAENVKEFGENLYNKNDMVTKREQFSQIKNAEFPQYMGTVKGIEQFDAHFFRVTQKQAACIDPAVGKLMEHTFQALFDAGINPVTLKNSKIGVFIASMQMDTVNALFEEKNADAYHLTGASKTMFANRISYWIDGKGPSFAFDYGCAGSTAALEMAYNSLKHGTIDCAIVGGSNYIIQPELTQNLQRAGLLCLDGKTKCFDKYGDGYARSDAVNVYFLQKAKDAKRVYSEVYHVKGKYFASPDGLFTPMRNPKEIEKFLDEFYSEIDVSPTDVEYVEANSFGIAEADGNELEAIGEVFAKNKTINIGNVKSNVGNTEAASGACAVIKMCLAYQKGQIPPNLHYNEPQNHISAVKEGKIQVVTENLPFSKNFTAINNFCYTGGNFHTLLKGHYKPKDTNRYKSSIPRLVLISGRKEDAVNNILNILETNPIDPEQCALLNNFYKDNVAGYTGRGYTILDSNENDKTVCLSRGFEFFSGNTRPVWYVFSGMGSQWVGMGAGLLRIPVFASAIEKCHKILLPKGLDLIKIISDKNSDFNILTSIVGITAIQIGICDVLTSMGIVPDNIIGHSVGEIGCAYADGCLTAEETILASYCRGLAAYETEFIKGAMAAIGLGHQELAQLCPPEIDVACHNSSGSSTISGPADDVAKFVKNLTDQGIFAKEVNSYGISFHSRYIAKGGPKMLNLLKKVITSLKPRSKKWHTTCYLPEDWHKPESQNLSPEYLTHNLLGPVLFEEAAKFIPEDAIIVEIAPHGLLQAVMKRSHSECVNLPLTRKGEDGATFFLQSIGRLYQIGLNPDLETLYPKVEFPVATETSTMSHFVKWDYAANRKECVPHTKEFFVENDLTMSVYDDEFAYIKDYVQNGVNVLPEAFMLVFVWKILANMKNLNYENMSIKFEDITIHKQITISPEDILRLKMPIQSGSNKFQVICGNNIVLDGTVHHVKKTNNKYEIIHINENEKHLTQQDIYTYLRSIGYSYGKNFQSIISSNIGRNKASVKWDAQWVTFLDSIIQLKTLSNDHDNLSRVKFIRNLTIDTDEHKSRLLNVNGVQYYNALMLENTGVVRCGGVIIEDLIFTEVPKIETIPDIQKVLDINILDNEKSRFNYHTAVVDKNNVRRIELVAKEPNNINSLTWTDAQMISNTDTIQVCYSGLSTKDCKRLSGSDDKGFGMDFSGINKKGEKVMGILPRGAMASVVEPDYDLLWPVPEHWSMAEAATVPLPFVHAYYCLNVRCNISKDSNVFIIGAAGALGQAAICIALSLGCAVYGTVANAEKKRFLLKLFPELDENNIGYTYDNTFRAMVIERTKNERCNIVISTGAGRIREAAMGCVGFMGNFLDMNDNDQKENKNMSMFYLTLSKSYKSVNMSTIFSDKYNKCKKVLNALVSDGIAKGVVRPLTSVIFSPFDVSRALKLLSARSNRGRVLININELTLSKQDVVQIPRLSLYPSRSCIVLWDGSELGVQLIDLLVKRGAKRLLIHCNPKLMTGYFHVKYTAWNKAGVKVEFSSDDLQSADKCQNLIIKTETKLGLLDGVFITCNDHKKTDYIQEEKSNIAKIVSNLDAASQKCRNLRYFGVVATISHEIENENKWNEIEKCCSRRKNLGLPSLYLRHVVRDQILHQTVATAIFNVLESSLKYKYANVRTSCTDEKDIGTTGNNITLRKLTDFGAGLKAFYSHISDDEVDSTEPIVQMKTKLRTNLELEMNLNPEDTYLIMIPGFEGISEPFSTMSELLKKRAIVLQLDPNNNDSIPQIAKNLLKHLRTRIHIKSPFHIMGYSFGVNVALEMAALLEKEDRLGVVYCLDSSPEALRSHLDAYLGVLTDEQLQRRIIEHFNSLLVGDNSDELMENINKTPKWSEKIEIFIRKAKYDSHHSHEYMKSLLNAFYLRIKMAKEYKPAFKLDSELVLLKGLPHPNAKHLSKDYNLSAYTNKPVAVLDIESDHAMALQNFRVPNYINRFFFL